MNALAAQHRAMEQEKLRIVFQQHQQMLETLRQIGLRYGPTITLQQCTDLARDVALEVEANFTALKLA